MNRRRRPCHAPASTRVRTRVRSYAPPRRALPPTPSSPPPPCGVMVRRLDMLLAPTAWRRRFFVSRLGEIGPRLGCSSCLAAAREVQALAIGPHRSVEKCPQTPRATRALSGPSPLRAQVLAALQDPGPAEIAPRRRRCRSRSAWAAPRAKGFSRHGDLPEGVARQLFSTSGPKGPRRRLRGRVPGNTGRRAGGARGARAQEQVQVGARCGARVAR